MKTRESSKGLVLASILVWGVTAASRCLAGEAPAADPEASLTITVRVYNYAQVPPKLLAQAEAKTGRIFRKAGIETVWVDCLLAEEQSDSGCTGPLPPSSLILRIIRRSMAPRATFRQTTSGYALQSTDGRPGTLAAVFYDRVEHLAREARLSRALILGHTTAHEIGHLLLGTNSHSPRGLMCADLQREDLKLASLGKLHFTPQESQRIRADVRKRMGRGKTVENSRLAARR